MKVSCLQESLTWGLGIVRRTLATGTNRPMNNNVLLATDQSRLKLVATDLERSISCWVGAKVEEEGTIAVPAEPLIEFVKSRSTGLVVLSVAPQSETLSVLCDRCETRISGIYPKDYCSATDVLQGITTTVDVGTLRKAISYVVFAAAPEGSRPTLKGMHAVFEASKLTLEAADGFRLAVYEITLSKPVKQKVEVIIPAPTIKELNMLMSGQLELEVSHTSDIDIKSTMTSERIIITGLNDTNDVVRKEESPMDSSATVDIIVDPIKNRIQFKLGRFELASQLILGRFPKHEQLVPLKPGTKTTLYVTEFLRAIRTASIFARDGEGFIRLIVSPGKEPAPGKITVYARSEGIGDNVSEVDALVEGNESKIAFNAKYLAEVLGVMNEKLVTLETADSSNPAVIKPVGIDNFRCVIMPMSVQW